jgi:alpha-L-rhamnosidase
VYGLLTSAWRLERERFVLDLTVPANTSAEVTLWDARVDRVQESGLPLNTVAGVRDAHQRGNDLVVDVGSGHYVFTVTLGQQTRP